jgi:hypothetical protein
MIAVIIGLHFANNPCRHQGKARHGTHSTHSKSFWITHTERASSSDIEKV